MTEQLQQLRGKSLSNEQHGNTVEALPLTVAGSQHFVDHDACLGMHDLVFVIYGTVRRLRISLWVAGF